MSDFNTYNTIHINFERTKDLNCADKCDTAVTQKMYNEYLWGGVSGLTCGTDRDTGDIVFFYMEDELPMKNENEYVSKYLYYLKKAWKKAGFNIIEEREAEPYECVDVGFRSHFFRLRKVEISTENKMLIRLANRCVCNAFSTMFIKYQWAMPKGYTIHYDYDTNDILFFFDEASMYSNAHTKEFFSRLRKELQVADFTILEEGNCEKDEFSYVNFPSHFFRLKSN